MNIANALSRLVVTAAILFSVVFMLSGCEKKADSAVVGNVENDISNDNSQITSNKIGAFILKSDTTTKSFEQGAQLAASSQTTSPLEFKFFDAAEGNSLESASLKSLVEKDKVPAILYWSVDDIINVAPYLSNSNTVGLVSWEVTKKVIPLGANIYGFGYSTELTFKELAKFAGNKLKSYRFAVLSATESRFDTQSKVFIEESKSLGNTIVFDEKVPTESLDFNSYVIRAGKENCDTIFAVLPTPALVQFIKAVRANKFKGKLIVGDTLFASDIAALGQDAEGVYMVQSWSDDSALKTLYSSKFGNTPDGVTLGAVALGYDTVKCLQNISAPIDAASIKYSLLSQSCEGLTGKTQFSGERMALRRKQILSIKNGQFNVE